MDTKCILNNHQCLDRDGVLESGLRNLKEEEVSVNKETISS